MLSEELSRFLCAVFARSFVRSFVWNAFFFFFAVDCAVRFVLCAADLCGNLFAQLLQYSCASRGRTANDLVHKVLSARFVRTSS